MLNNPYVKRYDFLEHGVLAAATTAGARPFVQAKTGNNTPTIVTEKGHLKLALTADEEAQVQCAYMGDILPFRVRDIKQLRILAKCTAIASDSAVEAILGLASARADDPDSIAEGIFWKVKASNALVVESDDGSTNNDDKDTGETLSTTLKLLVFDFDNGVLPRSPLESGSVGGSSHVLARCHGSNDKLKRVCSDTIFTFHNYDDADDYLQLIFQIYKSSSTDTGTLYVKWAEVELRDTING